MCTSLLCSAMVALLAVIALPCRAATQNAVCDATATAFENVSGLLQNRNYERAAQALGQLHGCPNLSALEMFQIGWLYGRARHFDTALQVFHSVPADVPDRLTHRYAIALSKFELTDYQGAANALKDFSSGTLDAKCANLLAVSYSKLGRYREADAILTQQTQNDPHDLQAYLNLVTVCAESGNFAQAAQVASDAAQLFPRSSEVFIVEGAANILLGHLDQAYNDFSIAVNLDPSRTDTRFFMALTDYKQGKLTDAAGILRTANKKGPADSDLHYLLAECLLKLNALDTASAIAELNRAIELDSNSVSARTLRGRLLLETGHPTEAVADLELASHRDPESRSATYNLARAYRALGKTNQARALFQQLRGQTSDTLTALGDRKLNDALAGKGGQP